MQPLEKPLRSRLEKTIKDARDIAEAAARAALEQLGVGDALPFAHLSEIERELRRKLRIHGRQLGDDRNSNGIQDISRLVEEVAYEHWHRMLFARFLAENNLLMYPDPDGPVAITLAECDDLAADEGAANGWELAARFAAQMLPQIFRLDSPVFQLALPPEHQQKMERLVMELPLETFSASDSLGWVYQFWQANNKERINKSEVKIGARELPAVTQLFTEPYMVSFLLDNSLGAWWAARQLSESDLQHATSESELREKAAIPGVPLEYLRFVKTSVDDPAEVQNVSELWTSAAGTFDQWPKQLGELKILDPCCGSGHFLVAAFLMLVPMRMALEDLTAREAVDRVLSENLHGLELDQRCVELAAFALALTAWRYPDAGGYRPLPELHIACSGLSVSVAKEEWKQLGLGKKNLTIALDWLHDTFKDAPVLGSLLNPAKTQAANLVQWEELSQTLNQALNQEQNDEQHEIGVVAQGLAKAATLLADQYYWVITNVPYLARGKQDKCLQDFCEKYYPTAKSDLATVFLDRCLQLCSQGGTASIVLPQNWLSQTTYSKFREQLLRNDTLHLLARLGPGAFETISGEVVKAILLIITNGNIENNEKDFFIDNLPFGKIRGVDVSHLKNTKDKADLLLASAINSVDQAQQLSNPDIKIIISDLVTDSPLLSIYSDSFQGLMFKDRARLIRYNWEIFVFDEFNWLQSSFRSNSFFSGKQLVLNWTDFEKNYKILGGNYKWNSSWGRLGVGVSQMGSLPRTIYLGDKFDGNIDVIIPKEEVLLPALWEFISSNEYIEKLRAIDPKLDVNTASLIQTAFEKDYWIKVAGEKYPLGLPKPFTNDPTQWIFHGHPCGSVVWDGETKWTANGPLRTDDTVLQVAVACLLDYRWPAELDTNMVLADQQREWVKRCEALLMFADEDGIVCLPPVRGEASATDRLLNLLAAAYGDAWSNDILAQLLNSADHAGKTLETWLREKFFTQHCKLFQQRPFIWHIWDGLRDGFAALVNYHKLDYKLLETLIYTYLGDWISRQKQDIANGIDGAEEKLAAAENLKKKLELILAGEAPYDIFVRWKPLDKQPIGWNPDLNDGVRLNIRPFMSVPDVGKRGAGILRDKPNIKWDKDRGKDVESASWFHVFNGDRINDYHLTLAEKNAARENKKL